MYICISIYDDKTQGGSTITRQHTSAAAFVSIRQHTSAYVSMRPLFTAVAARCIYIYIYIAITPSFRARLLIIDVRCRMT